MFITRREEHFRIFKEGVKNDLASHNFKSFEIESALNCFHLYGENIGFYGNEVVCLNNLSLIEYIVGKYFEVPTTLIQFVDDNSFTRNSDSSLINYCRGYKDSICPIGSEYHKPLKEKAEEYSYEAGGYVTVYKDTKKYFVTSAKSFLRSNYKYFSSKFGDEYRSKYDRTSIMWDYYKRRDYENFMKLFEELDPVIPDDILKDFIRNSFIEYITKLIKK